MNRDALTRLLLRGVAVAIALAATIDPAITTNRATRPEIVVRPIDSVNDAALADRVAHALDKRFTVVRTPFAGANATVFAGSRVPDAEIGGPAFAVVPNEQPTLSIERLDVPRFASAGSRVPVIALVRLTNTHNRPVEITLRSSGLVLDQTTRSTIAISQVLRVPLGFIPPTTDVARLRVTASLGSDSASADAAVDVRDRKWSVLFFDPRPSWMSTFVRRAVERDARFDVTSRIVTSRNVSTDAGRPPARLDELRSLESFDAIVVGAPEALSSAEVAGLDQFMRRRGGGVLMLLDQRAPGSYDRLTGVMSWASNSGNAIVPIGSTDSDTALRASELAWPNRLPAGAELVAGGARSIVWRSPVGAGRLVVSGALDAWRFRDRSASDFDRFWQELIGETANASPPAIAIETPHDVVAPGELIDVHATIRDAVLGDATPAPVSASMDSIGSVSLWPDTPGELRGSVRAPQTPGTYRLRVISGTSRAELPVVVSDDVRRPTPSRAGVLQAWSSSHGGRMLTEAELDKLGPMLLGAIGSTPQVETWHPMRSAWWIVPFTLALCGEWWLRRRRGLK